MELYSKTDKIEVAQKRRKNADAQAAFRQRRAAYYQSLEDVIEQLDNRLLALQDELQEAHLANLQMQEALVHCHAHHLCHQHIYNPPSM